MELQLAVQSARSNGRSHISNATKDIPNYLKPSTGSCHHVCKYGGTHTFEERDAHKTQPKPRKQPPASSDHQKRSLIRVRLVPRKLFGDRCRGEKAEKAVANDKEKRPESVEWKDIVAYDTVPSQHGSLPELDKHHQVMGSGDANKDVVRGKKAHDKADNAQQVHGVNSQNESVDKKLVNKSVRSKMMTSKVSTEPTHKNMNNDTKSVRPPRGKKPTVLIAKRKAEIDQELVDGYQPLSPSLLQKRASLLRDLEEEMVHEAATMDESKPAASPLDQEEFAAAETSRPIPAHRRVKSMSISSRSVPFPFARQASKNSVTFKLRSRSSKGPIILPSEDEKPPARLRSRRGSMGGSDDVGSTGSGRGIQLRIRSLRRRGVGGSGGASTGFVVPAVSLRHQKTLEKKRSQRLYNNMIEETASKLVKSRKSRVKALVGAFESVISKIAK